MPFTLFITMARRFSRLEAVRLLTPAAQRYQAWEDARSTRQPQVGTGTARGTSSRITLTPFGFDPGTGTKVITKVSERANNLLSGALGSHITATIAAADQSRPGFIPARIVVFQGTGSTVVRTSEITGLPYLRRNGTSYTHAFGAATATEKEIEALNDITTAILAQNQNRTVSYKPESQRKI